MTAGFHQDLTGRENVYLNGAILGMCKVEIARRFDQIVEFSGIGDFIDTPVKRYSSGMNARLGFSIAAHLEPAVLIVDLDWTIRRNLPAGIYEVGFHLEDAAGGYHEYEGRAFTLIIADDPRVESECFVDLRVASTSVTGDEAGDTRPLRITG